MAETSWFWLIMLRALPAFMLSCSQAGLFKLQPILLGGMPTIAVQLWPHPAVSACRDRMLYLLYRNLT